METGKDVGLLLAGCLIFNEGAPLPRPGRTAPAATIISQLMPLYDFTPRSAYEADVYRSLSMFRSVPGGTSCGIDFGRLFTDALGVGAQTFAEFCYAIGAQYLNLTEAALNENPGLFFIDSNYFSQTRLSAELLNRLIDRVAISEDALAAGVRAAADRPASDLTLLQLHPLIRHVDGRLFCLDVNFLLDKAGRGLYWTLRNAAPEALHRTLPGAYGNLFDAYVTSVFGSSCLHEKKNQNHPSPRRLCSLPLVGPETVAHESTFKERRPAYPISILQAHSWMRKCWNEICLPNTRLYRAAATRTTADR